MEAKGKTVNKVKGKPGALRGAYSLTCQTASSAPGRLILCNARAWRERLKFQKFTILPFLIIFPTKLNKN